jgi:hypothetical protein
MDVSTDYLKTFVAVSECNSFSLAVSRVHKSQGAIQHSDCQAGRASRHKTYRSIPTAFSAAGGLSGLDFPPAEVLERN